MTRVLVDSSVVVKWYHEEGESEVDAARAILFAHVREEIDLHILDLALYEVGNVLTRALRWAPEAAAEQLYDLIAITGSPIGFSGEWFYSAAELSHKYGLSFYDAAWAATAQALSMSFVTSDRAIQRAGLGESPAVFVDRLKLRL